MHTKHEQEVVILLQHHMWFSNCKIRTWICYHKHLHAISTPTAPAMLDGALRQALQTLHNPVSCMTLTLLSAQRVTPDLIAVAPDAELGTAVCCLVPEGRSCCRADLTSIRYCPCLVCAGVGCSELLCSPLPSQHACLLDRSSNPVCPGAMLPAAATITTCRHCAI